MLSDEDPQVRQTAIRSLGSLRHKEALPRLHELISQKGLFGKEEDADTQEAVCAALGKIEDESSVPFLMEALSCRSFVSLKKAHPKNVRVAAARALTTFTHREDVRQALLAALKDKDPYLRKTVADIISH
jgi:HEAT repeat protein